MYVSVIIYDLTVTISYVHLRILNSINIPLTVDCHLGYSCIIDLIQNNNINIFKIIHN